MVKWLDHVACVQVDDDQGYGWMIQRDDSTRRFQRQLPAPSQAEAC